MCKSASKGYFFEDGIEKYYTVAFLGEKAGDFICVSSQIGCPEKCLFCATGDQTFVRNLTEEEIYTELEVGVSMVENMVTDIRSKQISIIFEGMGEASYNIEACFTAFDKFYSVISGKYEKIILRVSSSGNCDLCEKYKKYYLTRKDIYKNVEFQLKLSLHTPYDSERKYLMSNVSNRFSLSTIMQSFINLSKLLGTKLICNYVLFSYPNGQNNYSNEHAFELGKIIDKEYVKMTLGTYSETGKGFVSPEKKTYEFFYNYLNQKLGIETEIIELYGQDINAACGMLNYKCDKSIDLS